MSRLPFRACRITRRECRLWLTSALRGSRALLPVATALAPAAAQASIFEGETLDAVANGAAWVVLVIAPAIAIGLAPPSKRCGERPPDTGWIDVAAARLAYNI